MAREKEKLFKQANDFFYKNDYDNAIEIYREILKKDPSHFQSHEKIAKIEESRGNLNKAAEHYRLSLEINPDISGSWNDLGNILYELKDFDFARAAYEKAINLNKEAYWAYYNIGLVIKEKYTDEPEKSKEAKDWFLKAVGINSNYHPALNELGVFYLDNFNDEKAEEYFNRAIKACKNYKYPYFNLSKIAKNRDQTKQAKEYLRKAISIDKNYLGAYNCMGILFYNENDYYTALYYYSKAHQIDPQYKYALYNAGLVFDSLGKYRKAYELHKKVIEIDPEYENAAGEKARLLKEYPSEIKDGEELTEKDMQPSTYKSKSNIVTGDDTGKKEKENKNELYSEKFGRNITKLAKEGKLPEILGRENEIKSILEVLFKIKKNNPIIVGRAGVGKTAIVEGLAQKIVSGNIPDFFKNMEIIEINMGMLVAGTKYRGEFEVKLKKIIEELQENENIILFIDEIHTIIGAGETEGSSLDAANILKPALARGELRCIGATTTEEYIQYIQKDSALERRFYKISVSELNKDASLKILKNLKPKMEKHYKIKIDADLLNLIINLSDEEIKNRVFPDKAIDIMEKSFSRCALEGKKTVDRTTVKNIVGEFVGIKFLDTEKDKHLLQMERFLKEQIYGQDHAIDAISKIILMTKQKLDLKPYQPDGVFFFAGPTGVGKTYLAKQISAFLYGSENKLITLNMSEYSEPHSVSRLIGSPPGYVGYSKAAIFSTEIMENPSSLLLLDEVEKAHPEVLKIFLQIFDEGKILDARGKTIHFSNITIIMTSNAIGIKNTKLGFNTIDSNEKPDLNLTEIFPPEFVNRIDEVILFNYISRETAKHILSNLIIEKSKRIFEKRGIELDFNSTFIDYIIELGYSRNFGVRNLERTYEKEVLASISGYLFENPHTSKIYITAENGRVEIRQQV